MKLGMTGTQTGLSDRQLRILEFLLISEKFSEFHHGDCIGADAEAAMCVYEYYPTMTVISHPPINEKKRAFVKCHETRSAAEYPERNHNIVNATDLLIAFPDGEERMRSGTWATIRYAKKNKKSLVIVYPDGSIEKFNMER